MALTNLPDGVSSFGIPCVGSGVIPVGSTYLWVDSATGSDGNNGEADAPFATIDAAIGRCTASKGYVILVKQGYTQTTTSAITLDVAGVTIVGLGVGRNRPAITANFSSAGDTLTVTAANCMIQNLRFVSSSASQNAQVNVAAADFQMINCVVEQGASNLIGVTIASGGDRFLFQGCTWLGTANGPDVAIDFESSASDNFSVIDCMFNFDANGCDLGVIRANADAVIGGLIQGCQFLGVDTVAIDFNSSVKATGDGLVNYCTFIASAALTSIEDIIDVGGYNFSQCFAADAVTGRAAPVPITTVS